MLRNRSSTRAAVTSKQPNLMGTDQYNSSQSPNTNTVETQNNTKSLQSFLVSPKFKALTKYKAETESPTSILDNTKSLFSPVKNPILSDHTNQPRSPKPLFGSQQSWEKKSDSKGIRVALIDDDNGSRLQSNNSNEGNKNPSNRMVLFATKLRLQIPPPLNRADYIESPSDFGTRTENSPSHVIKPTKTTISESPSSESHVLLTGCMNMSEMELSEEYTCVTSRGPNPRTTHIFDNCIVMDNYCDSSLTSVKSNNNENNYYSYSPSSPKSFLSFCHTCLKNLEQKDDIYIYRGEKAFCSRECRYEEMQLDGAEN